ncbi:hypothetical protein E4T38_00948 [Aureobasidium subglaciale]|nr:hypothetical protein E4T38_00948 [Aureobasidium subglaciale]KAI5230828.1 hypothetical protein E4T40_00949 [Aureobasidium subglaciale]KAI5233783.1 hypothetical protein E4T41_00947 [Aureobasidium subglaciale]KAI5267243.1 hypothetical protein E4T46_00947 [Aureobasidium subglaciale]
MAFPNPKAQLKYTSIRNVLSASGPAVVDEQTPSPVDTEPTVKEQSHSVVAEYQHLEICHICEGEEILIALPCGHSWCHDCMTRGCSARCYCAKRNCSAFIPPALVFIDDLARCGECGTSTYIVGVREEDQWVLDDDAAIPIDPADDEELQQRFQMSVLDNVILQMRLLQRPASADNSTMNFNQIFRVQGYEGPLIWYRPDGHPVFGQSDEDFPSGRDLAFSDVVLFHVFNAAELVSDAEEEPEGGVQYAADDDYVM